MNYLSDHQLILTVMCLTISALFLIARGKSLHWSVYLYRKSSIQSFQQGFTLIELLTILAVMTIIAVLAIPQWSELYKQTEVRTLVTNVPSFVQGARTEALMKHHRLMICGSASTQQCDHNWNKGLLVFHDLNHNSLKDAEELAIDYLPLGLKYGQLRWVGAGGRNMIIYNAQNGMPLGSNGSLIYCSSNIFHRRQFILSPTGRVSLRDLNRDGIYENAEGDPIICP